MAELWTYRPTIGTGETLEWFSEVFNSRTSEQRLCLRPTPRQSFEYSTILEDHEFSMAKQFARQNSSLPIKVPVWVEATELGTSLLATDNSITFDTTTGDYRVGSDLMVWDSNSHAILATIVSLSSTEVIFADQFGSIFNNAVVAPVRIGYATEGFKYSRESTFANVGVRFLITDNSLLTWVTDYPQYGSLDVVTEETIMVSDINESIVRAIEYVDSGFGPIVPETVLNYDDFGQTLGFVEYGAEALWRRRKWLHNSKGKQKTFWLPSFNEDLQLTQDIAAASFTISVVRIGLTTGYLNKHIMIELTDGTRYFRQITSASDLINNVDLLGLNAAIPTAVDMTEIRHLSFMSKVRFNSDSVQIDYMFTGITTITIPVMEVID